MADKVWKSDQDNEVYFILEATHLFGAIIQTLKGLESHDDYLADAMASAGYGVQQRLSSLLGVVELLKSTRDAAHASALIGRAKVLIASLGAELDELAALAEQEYSVIPPLDDGVMPEVLH
jgi:hypothetical protein